MLKFKGSQQFRQRIVFSTLSGKPIRIDDIRADSENPGLQEGEACFLRLVEKLTNGCAVEINETGTTLRFKPGLITGGRGLTHECGAGRALGYFLEPLLYLMLFAKKPMSVTLRGVTNDDVDPCVDTFRSVTLPLLRQVGIEEGLELKIVRRAAATDAGGEVVLTCPVVRALKPVQLLDAGLVKRIRGIAYSTRVSPQAANRMVDGARAVLNPLLPDVYIFTDHAAGKQAGSAPGFGLCLVAESTSGCLVGSQAAADAARDEPAIPEEVGALAAKQLLREISSGGVVDSAHQSLALIFAAFGPEEVMKVRMGPLAPAAVLTLRHLRAFFGVTFKLEAERDASTVLASCVGINLSNMARAVS